MSHKPETCKRGRSRLGSHSKIWSNLGGQHFRRAVVQGSSCICNKPLLIQNLLQMVMMHNVSVVGGHVKQNATGLLAKITQRWPNSFGKIQNTHTAESQGNYFSILQRCLIFSTFSKKYQTHDEHTHSSRGRAHTLLNAMFMMDTDFYCPSPCVTVVFIFF